MTPAPTYLLNRSTATDVAAHLKLCDQIFVPPLSQRVDIDAYAAKIAASAARFEAWSKGVLAGLLAMYCNDLQARVAYITSVSVLPPWARMGIAANLLEQCIAHAAAAGMHEIRLEVAQTNLAAIGLYEKKGFAQIPADGPSWRMSRILKGGDHGEK